MISHVGKMERIDGDKGGESEAYSSSPTEGSAPSPAMILRRWSLATVSENEARITGSLAQHAEINSWSRGEVNSGGINGLLSFSSVR